MEQPADTLNYLVAGFIVIFGTIATYIVSLICRWRRYSREIGESDQAEN